MSTPYNKAGGQTTQADIRIHITRKITSSFLFIKKLSYKIDKKCNLQLRLVS